MASGRLIWQRTFWTVQHGVAAVALGPGAGGAGGHAPYSETGDAGSGFGADAGGRPRCGPGSGSRGDGLLAGVSPPTGPLCCGAPGAGSPPARATGAPAG